MEDNVIENNKNDDEVSLRDLIVKFQEWYSYLLSKWILILVFGIIGGILGLAYAYKKAPIYTATTTFVLEEDKGGGGGLGSLAGLASMAGIDVGGGGGGVFQGDNILALYKSRSMIERTLLTEIRDNHKNQLLIDRYIEFNHLRKKWASHPELNNINFSIPKVTGKSDSSFTRLQDSIIATIVKDIDDNYLVVSKPDKKLSIIKAEVKAPDELFAKNFNNEIVKNVNDFYIQTKTKKSLYNVSILQQKVDSVRSVMYGAISSAAAIMDATPNLNVTRQIQRSSPVQRSQFSAETNKAMLTELVKNLELSKISLRREAPLIQVIDQPVFPLDVVKFGKIKGFVLGGFLMGVLVILWLVLKKIFKEA